MQDLIGSRRSGDRRRWVIAAIIVTTAILLAACGGRPEPSAKPVVTGKMDPSAQPSLVDATPSSLASTDPAVDATPAQGGVRSSMSTVDPTAVTLESIEVDDELPGDRLVTSDRFGLPVTFWFEADEWCTPRTGRGWIALTVAYSCSDSLTILGPSAIACGSGPAPTTSDALATRLLARPDLGARDRGAVADDPTLPKGFFEHPMRGRIIDVYGAAPSVATIDLHGCIIRAGDTTMEIRRDHPVRLVALDTHDGLVILALMTGPSRDVGGRWVGGGAGLSSAALSWIHGLAFGDSPS